MGIFGKLFGGTKDTDNFRVRAQYKDAKYFQKEIERFEQIIAASPEPTRPFHYWSRASKLNILMDLEYSLGKPFDSLKDIYLRALDNLVKGWNKEDPTYEDFLNLLAKGVLLDIPDAEFQRLVKYLEQADKDAPEGWKPDALAWYLIRGKMKVNTNENVNTTMSPEIDQRLFDLTKLPKSEAEEAVKEYLEDWYRLRKQSAWYNSHTRDRGYSGYWAWDVAAVVKIMGLDDSSFKDNPYYPQT